MRFDCQVFPVRIVRTQGANFELRCYPRFDFEASGDRKKDALDYILDPTNGIVEYVDMQTLDHLPGKEFYVLKEHLNKLNPLFPDEVIYVDTVTRDLAWK